MLCIAMSGGVLRAEARGLLYLYQSKKQYQGAKEEEAPAGRDRETERADFN
jgi:hypothetical protein